MTIQSDTPKHIDALTRDLRSALNDIFKPLNQLDPRKIQVFVHGSWADNSRTAFSDLDDLVIVRDEYFEEAKPILDEIELSFQQIDPLQHHGHWIIKSSQLENYDASYMPLHIMTDAIPIFGSPEIVATINSTVTKTGLMNNIITTCKNIDSFFNLFQKNELNVYDLKAFVSSIALIPPMLFQLEGKLLNKKVAISRAHEIFNNKEILLLQWASEMRNNWNEILKDEKLQKYFRTIKMEDNAEKLRNRIKRDAPVISFAEFCETELTRKTVGLYLARSFSIIDNQRLKNVDRGVYEKTYKKIEEIAIENGAIIVGRFGQIANPGISDLDMCISFRDQDFAKGCNAVQTSIINDSDSAYLFTHPPYFVPEGSLKTVDKIHTLSNLKITHNRSNRVRLHSQDSQAEKFLNINWAFLVYRTLLDLENDVFQLKYVDTRQLLLILKMVHTSIDFIIRGFGLLEEETMKRSIHLRELVSNGIAGREEVLAEFETSKEEFFHKLSRVGNVKYKSSESLSVDKKTVISPGDPDQWTKRHAKYGVNYSYLPPLFYFQLKDLLLGRNKNARRHMRALKKNIQIHQKCGKYLDSFTLIFSEHVHLMSRKRRISDHLRWKWRQRLKYLFVKVRNR